MGYLVADSLSLQLRPLLSASKVLFKTGGKRLYKPVTSSRPPSERVFHCIITTRTTLHDPHKMQSLLLLLVGLVQLPMYAMAIELGHANALVPQDEQAKCNDDTCVKWNLPAGADCTICGGVRSLDHLIEDDCLTLP